MAGRRGRGEPEGDDDTARRRKPVDLWTQYEAGVGDGSGDRRQGRGLWFGRTTGSSHGHNQGNSLSGGRQVELWQYF